MEHLKIVGAHFRPPAKAILAALPLGSDLELRPEPTNQYDPNAIAVWVQTSSIPHTVRDDLDLRAKGYGYSADEIFAQSEFHLGYIPKEEAKRIIHLMPPEALLGKLACLPQGDPSIRFHLPTVDGALSDG